MKKSQKTVNNSDRKTWTRQELRLIAQVKRHPPLYEDRGESRYGTEKYEMSWNEVSKNLKRLAIVCKNEWMKIIQNFNTHLMNNTESKYLDGTLSFVKPPSEKEIIPIYSSVIEEVLNNISDPLDENSEIASENPTLGCITQTMIDIELAQREKNTTDIIYITKHFESSDFNEKEKISHMKVLLDAEKANISENNDYVLDEDPLLEKPLICGNKNVSVGYLEENATYVANSHKSNGVDSGQVQILLNDMNSFGNYTTGNQNMIIMDSNPLNVSNRKRKLPQNISTKSSSNRIDENLITIKTKSDNNTLRLFPNNNDVSQNVIQGSENNKRDSNVVLPSVTYVTCNSNKQSNAKDSLMRKVPANNSMKSISQESKRSILKKNRCRKKPDNNAKKLQMPRILPKNNVVVNDPLNSYHGNTFLLQDRGNKKSVSNVSLPSVTYAASNLECESSSIATLSEKMPEHIIVNSSSCESAQSNNAKELQKIGFTVNKSLDDNLNSSNIVAIDLNQATGNQESASNIPLLPIVYVANTMEDQAVRLTPYIISDYYNTVQNAVKSNGTHTINSGKDHASGAIKLNETNNTQDIVISQNEVIKTAKNKDNINEDRLSENTIKNNDIVLKKETTSILDVDVEESDMCVFFDKLADYVTSTYPVEKQMDIRSKICTLVTSTEIKVGDKT